MKNFILEFLTVISALAFPVGFMAFQPFPALTVFTLVLASIYLTAFSIVNSN